VYLDRGLGDGKLVEGDLLFSVVGIGTGSGVLGNGRDRKRIDEGCKG
jgi:hypothetical protein